MSCLIGIIFTKKIKLCLRWILRQLFQNHFVFVFTSSLNQQQFFWQNEAIQEPYDQSQSLSQTMIYVQISNKYPRLFFVTVNFECKGLSRKSHVCLLWFGQITQPFMLSISTVVFLKRLLWNGKRQPTVASLGFPVSMNTVKSPSDISQRLSYLLDRAARTYEDMFGRLCPQRKSFSPTKCLTFWRPGLIRKGFEKKAVNTEGAGVEWGHLGM